MEMEMVNFRGGQTQTNAPTNEDDEEEVTTERDARGTTKGPKKLDRRALGAFQRASVSTAESLARSRAREQPSESSE